MHNRHHCNHIHTLPLVGVKSFILVEDLVLGFSSYKLKMMLDSTLGASIVKGRTLGSSWPVVSQITTVSTFPSAVADKILLLVCFADR